MQLWLLRPPHIALNLLILKEKRRIDLLTTFLAIFDSHYSQFTVIYTDGSKDQGTQATEFAFAVPEISI